MTTNDLAKFWRDDQLAHLENCFYEKAPQMALGMQMSNECVFHELQEPGQPWGITPRARRIELNKRYNDLAEKMVGKRLLQEEFPAEDAIHPAFRRIGEVFGGSYAWKNGTEWLSSPIKTPQQLEKQLKKMETMDLRSFLLPDNWQTEQTRIFETYGISTPRQRHIRGPITLMCSIYGAEEFIYLVLDAPELAAEFSQMVAKVAIQTAELLDDEAGFTIDNAPHGFSFADDNCCLMTPAMYEQVGLPVLRALFERFSPNQEDSRYQHSDSAMGHLLPLLGQVGLTGVNFGPTVLIDQIRKYLPKACIEGCLSPIDLMRNDQNAIKEQLIRDASMAKHHGKGVNFTTAGSINDGSSLESMVQIMEGIVEFGRY